MSDVKLEWRAHDGTVWDWLSGSDGIMAGRGLSGLLFPDFEQRMAETQAGAMWMGFRPRPRKVSVKLQVGDNHASLHPQPSPARDPFFPNKGVSLARDAYRRGQEWRSLDRSVRHSLLPTRAGELACITPEGERTIRLLVDSVSDSVDTWSDLRGFQEYDVDFTSETAFWSGEPVTMPVQLATDTGTDYYQTKGPDFILSAGVQLSGTPVQNPGDVEAWPVWTIKGPGQFNLSVSGVETSTKVLAAGETVIIDTGQRTVVDDSGISAWSRLQTRGFAPIPAGESSDVVVTATDTGIGSEVTMSFRPQFMGAY